MKFIKFAFLVFIAITILSDFVQSAKHKKLTVRKLTSERKRLEAKFNRIMGRKTHLKSKVKSYLQAQTNTDTVMKTESQAACVDLKPDFTDVGTVSFGNYPKMLFDKVLVDVQEIELSGEYDSSQEFNICQSGYELVKDFDGNTVTDLNRGAGGAYIYLCVKYKEYGKLEPKEIPINELVLQIASNECGSLRPGQLDLNKGTNDSPIFLCRGYKEYDESRKNCPIDRVRTYTRRNLMSDYFFIKDGLRFDCDKTDMNYDAGSSYKIFLCYHRNCELPKEIKYENIYIKEDEKVVVNQSSEMIVDEFIMDNGDGGSDLNINIEVSSTTEESTTQSKTHSLEIKASGENANATNIQEIASVANPTAAQTAASAVTNFQGDTSNSSKNSGEVNVKFDWNKATKEGVANTATTGISCTAPAGSHYKCQKSEKITNYNIPYTYDAKYYTFSSKTPLVLAKEGVMSNIPTSEFVVKSCCYRFCSDSSVKCGGYVKPTTTETEICNTPVKQTRTVTQVKQPLPSQYDKEVLVDIVLLMGSSSQTCSSGYITDNQDLKRGSGGDTAYLCRKRQKLSKMDPKYSTINEIRVQYGNSNCGDLRLLSTAPNSKGETQSDISGTNQEAKIYICFGNNKNSLNYLITDFEIKIESYNSALNTTTGTIIKELMLNNLGHRNGSEKYLYVTRDSSLPKEVNISDYAITSFTAAEVTFPSQVDEIVVAGSSITKSISVSKSNTFTDSNAFEFGVGIAITGASLIRDPTETEVPESGSDIGTNKQASLEVSYTNNSETSRTKTISKAETQDITCTALPKKKVKCLISKSSRSMIKDYTYKQNFIGYDGTVLSSVTITGTSETKASTSLAVATCCLAGCCEGEEKDKAAGREDQCYDSSSKSWRPKDIKCEEYDQCLKNAKTRFNNSSTTTATSTAKK